MAALTFDDGPDPGSTPGILTLLGEHDCTASFFVLTDRLPAGGTQLHELLAAGHEIGVHGDRHESLTGVALEQCVERLRAMRHRLEDALGVAVRFYRPPFGRTSLSLLRAASRAGLVVVLWSHDPGDWAADAEPSLQVRLLTCLIPGAIVLLHDRRHPPSAIGVRSPLSAALLQAEAQGLELRTLSAALLRAQTAGNGAEAAAAPSGMFGPRGPG